MTPIEKILDGISWSEISTPDQLHADDLYATHEGALEIAGKKLRCYRLNNGEAIFDAEDLEDFFEDPQFEQLRKLLVEHPELDASSGIVAQINNPIPFTRRGDV